MKAIYTIIVIAGALLLCSCNKGNEVPPYQKTLTSTYVLPSPEPLNQEERAWLKELRTEYENAIKNQ